ncbi:MAG TPA: acyltransferase [Rhizomicrobium sp.]
MTPGPQAHFQALDSLRGIAALGVVLLHITWVFPGSGFQPVLHMGLMVDFFFVLSGFVIAFNYRERLSSGPDLGRFVWLRFWRLYPLHLAMLALFVAIEAGKHLARTRYGLAGQAAPMFDLKAIGTNLFLLQSLQTHPAANDFNAPSWSISAEFYTYILFALVVVLLGTGRRFIAAALAIMLASAVFLRLAPGPFALNCSSYLGIFRCTLGFFLGALLVPVRSRLASRDRGRAADAIAWASVAGVLLVLALPAGFSDLAIYLPVAILIVALSLDSSGTLASFLSLRPLRWLGAISYSIYMTHFAVTWLMAQALHLALHIPFELYTQGGITAPTLVPPAWLGSAWVIAAIALTLALSQITYAWIEEPFRLWSKRRAARPSLSP